MRIFKEEEVEKMLCDGTAIDGTNGGLVLGRSHDEGGVFILHERAGYYQLDGEMEGFEYIFNPAVAAYASDRFRDINKPDEHMTPTFEPYLPPKTNSNN